MKIEIDMKKPINVFLVWTVLGTVCAIVGLSALVGAMALGMYIFSVSTLGGILYSIFTVMALVMGILTNIIRSDIRNGAFEK